MKRILWTVVVAMVLTMALGSPAGAVRLDYESGKLSSVITTALSAGTWDERGPAGYPEATVSYTQQNLLETFRASASATGKVSTRPKGLTARFEVSATTSNEINEIFPLSDLRATANVITYDLIPGLFYTVTETSPMDKFFTHLMEYHFSWEDNKPHSPGDDYTNPSASSFLEIGVPGSTQKEKITFGTAGGGSRSIWGYLPASPGDRLWFFASCSAASSVPEGEHFNESTATFTVEADLVSYTRLSILTDIKNFIDDQIYSLVEVQPGEYGFQHVVSGEIFSPIQLETGKFLLLNERTGEVAVIPLPASVWLLGAGLLGLGWRRRTPR
jgi:hypothetical protein